MFGQSQISCVHLFTYYVLSSNMLYGAVCPYVKPVFCSLLCIRHKQLESILVVTQQFHETLEPLSEWLSTTEKHLANSEPIGTETSKLEDQISQHKVMHSILPHCHMLVFVMLIQFCSFYFLILCSSLFPIPFFIKFLFHFLFMCVFCLCHVSLVRFPSRAVRP